MSELCTGLFDHSMDKLETIETSTDSIQKKCAKCGYTEELPRSQRNIIFFNGNLKQTKSFAVDDSRKELLQPLTGDGEVNEDFTAAFGYNPFDERTKKTTPRIQGGLA